jgi:tRNA (guanine26-N2/guanine27-N2)-dimethyltransferase
MATITVTKKAYTPDFPSEIIHEGKADMLVPKLDEYTTEPSEFAPSKAPVFYNPVMEFNRDLSVLVFQTFQRMVDREISICEPLTSQGIRSIRYAKEIEGVKSVLAGDINRHAYALAKHNISLNGVEEKVTIRRKDANCTLDANASPKKRFDIVDLDPFGTPVPFIAAAVRALRNKGLLASTATDLAPLCGVHAKACLRKYGGKPLRTEYCHELAMRFLAGCTASLAAKHDISIKPLFCHSSDHYIRLYSQISYGAKKADESIKNLGYILHCFNCMHREVANKLFGCPTCPECGARMDYAGPLWTGNLWDSTFCKALLLESKKVSLGTSLRISKLLAQTVQEANAPITYYVIDRLSGKFNLPSVSNQAYLTALQNSGFSAVLTHFNTRGIRTNAPAKEMQRVLRELVLQKV